MNLILLDLIEQLGNDMTKVLSNTMFEEILNNVKNITHCGKQLTLHQLKCYNLHDLKS